MLASSQNLTEDEQMHLQDSHLLSNKPFVYACNVSEDMMDASEEELRKLT